MSRRVLVLSNPVAGRGASREQTARFVTALEARGVSVECFFTAAAGDARAHARGRAHAVDCIAVVGGDGTLNEVLNGVEDPGAIPLAHLPLGTANLLAREIDLPRSPEALADCVEQGHTRRIDLGHVGEHRFLMLASCGLDAMVVEAIQKTRKARLGFRGYVAPILKALGDYREPRLRVRLDDGEELEGAMVVVSNLRNYGGLFTVAEQAHCDSGHLDVCLFRRVTALRVPLYLVAGALARLSRLDAIAYRTARRVSVECDEPVATEVDGDYFGTTPVAIELTPRAVPIVVPDPGGARRDG